MWKVSNAASWLYSHVFDHLQTLIARIDEIVSKRLSGSEANLRPFSSAR